MAEVRFERLQASDLMRIERQPSQDLVLGVRADIDPGEADDLASWPVAWTALDRDDRVLACFGIAEAYAGVHGLAWSLLARGIGGAHLAITRKARSALAECGLQRVEVIAKAAATPMHLGGLDAVRWAMTAGRSTPECRWAMALGFRPAHLLQRYGALSEPHMLMEWFGGAL